MAVDNATLRTRRALLAAGLGGIAASAASAIAGPAVVRAGSDGDVVLGATNSTTLSTSISTSGAFALGGVVTGNGTALIGIGGTRGVHGQSQSGVGVNGWSHDSTGVYGESESATGVVGTSPSIGVSGTSTTGTGVAGSSGSGIGVLAYSNATNRPAGRGWSGGDSTGLQGSSGSDSPPAAPDKTGVYGYAAQDANAVGVHGQATTGRGVFGQATGGQGVRGYATTGSALYGSTSGAKSGIALRTVGRVRFEKSVGIATIAAGSRRVTVTPGVAITSSSAVVATLQGNPGGRTTVQRVSLNATADTFTIYLTANAKASVKVAWHIFG